MPVASLACLIAGSLSLIIGFIVTVLNMPNALVGFRLGVDPLIYVGAILIIVGIATYIAGFVVGIFAIRKYTDSALAKVSCILNGGFIVFIIFIVAIGVVTQNRMNKQQEERLTKYKAEREDKDLQHAQGYAYEYHKKLLEHKTLLLCTFSSEKLEPQEIAGVRIILLPHIDYEGSKTAHELITKNDYSINMFVRTLLNEETAEPLQSFQSLCKKYSISMSVNIGKDDKYDFKSISKDDYDWWINRKILIEALNERIKWQEEYEQSKQKQKSR